MSLLLETPTPTATELLSIAVATPEEIWSRVTSFVGPLVVPVLAALVVAALTIVVARKIRNLAQRSLRRARVDAAVLPIVSQLTYFGIICLGALWVLAILGVPPAGLLTAFGAAGLAFGLSLQDLLRNLIAGLYLLIEKPFRIGDRLMVRTFEGTVDSVDIRTTSLLTAKGERVVVPNAILFAEVLVNRGVPPAPAELDQAEEGPVG